MHTYVGEQSGRRGSQTAGQPAGQHSLASYAACFCLEEINFKKKKQEKRKIQNIKKEN